MATAAALSAAAVAAAGNFLPTQRVGTHRAVATAAAESLSSSESISSCPLPVVAGGSFRNVAKIYHIPHNVKTSDDTAALRAPREMALPSGLRDRYVF